MECLECHSEMSPQKIRRRAKFCSRECYGTHNGRESYQARQPWNLLVDTGTVGAIAELVVAIDLLQRRFDVFRAVSPSAGHDLVAFKGKTHVSVEVRTGRLLIKGQRAGNVYFPRNREHRPQPDHYAVVVHAVSGTKIFYFPELP